MRKLYIILLLPIILISGCANPFIKKNMENTTQNTTKKKIVMVVAPIDFRDQEYFDPRNIFDAAGYEVTVASIQHGKAKSTDGQEVAIDRSVSEIEPADYDAVAFIGGPGMQTIVGNESLQILAAKFDKAGKLTTSICVAPAIFAKAGILQGKKATSWDGVKSDLEASGAVYTGEEVTIDGKIITANGPAAAKKFGETIVSELSK